MLLTSLGLLAASTLAFAQQSINGMWSSGSQHVKTGPGFAEPQSYTFNVPSTTGICFSFDLTNMFWESSRFRMAGNAKDPQCTTVIVFWGHGPLEIRPNGTIICTVSEGFQLVENPCSPTSSFTEMYNQTYELYQSFQIIQDTYGTSLQLYAFDGSPLPPMGLVSQTPNMFPMQKIINNNKTTILASYSTNNALRPIHPWGVAAAATVGALLGSAFLVT